MDFNNKERFWNLWLPMTFGILTYSIGDVLLKIGNYELQSSLTSLFQGDFWISFISNLPIIIAFAFILASKSIMGYVYAKNPFGLTQGLFLALSVILAFILGFIIFSEMITFQDIIAIGAISLGIYFVYTSESYKSPSSDSEKAKTDF